MVDCFLVGSFYRYTGPKDLTADWNTSMNAWKDYTIRRCTFVQPNGHDASFERIDGTWNYKKTLEFFEEISEDDLPEEYKERIRKERKDLLSPYLTKYRDST